MADTIDPEELAPTVDALAAAQASLRAHRAAVDARALERQRAEDAGHDRRCSAAGAVLAAAVTPALTGDAGGLVAGAFGGLFAAGARRRGAGSAASIALTLVPTALWLALRAGSGRSVASTPLVPALGAVALAAVGGGLAWALGSPSRAAPSARGWSLLRRSAPPEELVARAVHAAAIGAANDALVARRQRWLHLRCVTVSAVAVWLLAPGFGFAANESAGSLALGFGATPSRAVFQAWCVPPCALAAAVISWREWGPLRAMALFGAAFFAATVSGLLLGLSGFSALLALWLWAAGVAGGGLLAFLVETADRAVAQRTA